ncbi:flagellar type III secretion system pore protein FliP [Massilia sp. CCM 8733]|uniref:Flagellar biosynthetic protein FliP n=1 Tax=Massilia mucilaginosa TaxID=2609282 RepID=A0ABX0NSP1_9BURK|nr:flagellar type III secretion system pore protein FliP [Massilia mucilaginosa]NHZ89934.1 flagellar type III secretion system pore protein FliP [Massilia mucilaginosa]
MHKPVLRTALLCALLCGLAGSAMAAGAPAISLPGVDININGAGGQASQVSAALKILLGLTVLSLAPALLVSVTSFIRITVVLSMLRHAMGMQETPPNTVLMSLALFLTFFTMAPVLTQVNDQAFQPFMNGKMEAQPAFDTALRPIRDFMVRQTREQDLQLMVEIAKAPTPATVDDISTVQLIPAFMLSELRAAFQIGFVIFLPFVLIDLIVSTILMALGMMMVPPVTISLPLKILMFVLIDGWNLVIRALLGTFN